MSQNKLTVVLLFLFPLSLLGQSPYPIKEYYDKLYSYYVPSTINYSNHSLTGNSLSWSLSGILRMYETTKDKAYLVKFNHNEK